MDITLDFFYSKAFHSLVHHALSSGSSSDAESKEEALAVYQDICEIIENQAKVKDISNILSIGWANILFACG